MAILRCHRSSPCVCGPRQTLFYRLARSSGNAIRVPGPCNDTDCSRKLYTTGFIAIKNIVHTGGIVSEHSSGSAASKLTLLFTALCRIFLRTMYGVCSTYTLQIDQPFSPADESRFAAEPIMIRSKMRVLPSSWLFMGCLEINQTPWPHQLVVVGLADQSGVLHDAVPDRRELWL